LGAVLPAVYVVLFLWAKKIGEVSRVEIWHVGRMKDRYESKALNVGLLGLSFTAAPIGTVLFSLGLFEVFSTDRTDLIALAAGLSLVALREIFIVVCDLFADRTPTVA
jgi:hypothetical protein